MEYHPMGTAIDDTIIDTQNKSLEDITRELKESGFTGKLTRMPRTLKQQTVGHVVRLECGTKACSKVSKVIN